ncbi:MAG: dicarboxylate/amino acid:cation symporter, partial [Acidobacteriota bacterium]
MNDVIVAEDKRRTPLHTKILIGLIVGATAGLAANQLAARGVIPTGQPGRPGPSLLWVVENLTDPIGQIFLNMLFMVVIPIVFCSLSLGVAHLGNVHRLGRLSAKTFGYFLLTTAASAMVGLALVNALQPGDAFDVATQEALIERFGGQAEEKAGIGAEESFWPEVLVGIVSPNPLRDAVELNMLPIIFTAVLFGLALTLMPPEKAEPTVRVLEGVGGAAIVIVGFAMRLAPYA